MRRFFTFRQNNSGGSFDVDIAAGISHVVIVEARDAEDANNRARSIGLYFGGVYSGSDCGCCGDRWYEQWREDDGTEKPEIYGKPAEEYAADYRFDTSPEVPLVYVHYVDGLRESYGQL